MSQVLANVPDVTTFAANIVVFLAAVAAAVAGAMSAVKKIKESWLDSVKNSDGPVSVKHQVAAATIMETTTLLRTLADEMRELRHEMELTRVTKGR